jgi:hypothetical protein
MTILEGIHAHVQLSILVQIVHLMVISNFYILVFFKYFILNNSLVLPCTYSNPCLYGICSNNYLGGYTCACSPGYTGITCQYGMYLKTLKASAALSTIPLKQNALIIKTRFAVVYRKSPLKVT